MINFVRLPCCLRQKKGSNEIMKIPAAYKVIIAVSARVRLTACQQSARHTAIAAEQNAGRWSSLRNTTSIIMPPPVPTKPVPKPMVRPKTKIPLTLFQSNAAPLASACSRSVSLLIHQLKGRYAFLWISEKREYLQNILYESQKTWREVLPKKKANLFDVFSVLLMRSNCPGKHYCPR